MILPKYKNYYNQSSQVTGAETNCLGSFNSKINNSVHIFSCCLATDYILMNATVCTINSFLCHDIKQAMSYHIMEFYVTTCHMSRLLQHL